MSRALHNRTPLLGLDWSASIFRHVVRVSIPRNVTGLTYFVLAVSSTQSQVTHCQHRQVVPSVNEGSFFPFQFLLFPQRVATNLVCGWFEKQNGMCTTFLPPVVPCFLHTAGITIHTVSHALEWSATDNDNDHSSSQLSGHKSLTCIQWHGVGDLSKSVTWHHEGIVQQSRERQETACVNARARIDVNCKTILMEFSYKSQRSRQASGQSFTVQQSVLRSAALGHHYSLPSTRALDAKRQDQPRLISERSGQLGPKNLT